MLSIIQTWTSRYLLNKIRNQCIGIFFFNEILFRYKVFALKNRIERKEEKLRHLKDVVANHASVAQSTHMQEQIKITASEIKLLKKKHKQLARELEKQADQKGEEEEEDDQIKSGSFFDTGASNMSMGVGQPKNQNSAMKSFMPEKDDSSRSEVLHPNICFIMCKYVHILFVLLLLPGGDRSCCIVAIVSSEC